MSDQTASAALRVRKYHQPWIPSLQGWSWIITIVWMAIALAYIAGGLPPLLVYFLPMGFTTGNIRALLVLDKAGK
ncbi:hypothetical protein FACS1894130_05210 [Spirochaetia bacterium]|nr:hypothetical protein FACS1894130_05210 [Spirochaetia bacterium]